MHEKTSQSLMDVLIRLMPELRELRKGRADPKLATLLYNKIWSKENSRVAGKLFNRPDDLNAADVDRLKADGLINLKGHQIEITDKGAAVVRQMILGDNRSVFEDDGKPVEYLRALSNLSPSRAKTSGKRASRETLTSGHNWYIAMVDSTPPVCQSCTR
jgi:hypothetical protein